MAFSPLGFSLPELSITGSVGMRAAWGGTLGVTATVLNTGTSTITNPIAQAPGSVTTADAPASTVAVVITPRPHSGREVTIGTFQAPPISQNSLEQIVETFTLPARPAGFAGGGGKFFVHLIANANSKILESHKIIDFGPPIPVMVASRALPELSATSLDVPPFMQPGDTIVPTITITNLGTAASGPVQVALVASTSKSFTVGSSIVALYTLTSSIPPASEVPPGGTIAAFSQTANPPNNTFTFTGARRHAAHQPGDVLPRRRGRSLRPDQSAQPARERAAADPGRGPARPVLAAGRRRFDGQLQPVPLAGLRRLHRHQSRDDHDQRRHRPSQHDHLIRVEDGEWRVAGSDRSALHPPPSTLFLP